MKKVFNLSTIVILFWSSITLISSEAKATEAISNQNIWQYSKKGELSKSEGVQLGQFIKESSQSISKTLNIPNDMYFSLEKTQRDNLMNSQDITVNIMVNEKAVGHIQFTLADGGDFINNPNNLWHRNLELQGDTELIKMISGKCGSSPMLAALEHIGIESAGQGYGSQALNLFNAFMNSINACCTVLAVDSKTPYAARTYFKAGYRFTPFTLERIKMWAAQSQHIENKPENTEQAMNKFLDDSSQSLGYRELSASHDKYFPLMIRWKD